MQPRDSNEAGDEAGTPSSVKLGSGFWTFRRGDPSVTRFNA